MGWPSTSRPSAARLDGLATCTRGRDPAHYPGGWPIGHSSGSGPCWVRVIIGRLGHPHRSAAISLNGSSRSKTDADVAAALHHDMAPLRGWRQPGGRAGGRDGIGPSARPPVGAAGWSGRHRQPKRAAAGDADPGRTVGFAPSGLGLAACPTTVGASSAECSLKRDESMAARTWRLLRGLPVTGLRPCRCRQARSVEPQWVSSLPGRRGSRDADWMTVGTR